MRLILLICAIGVGSALAQTGTVGVAPVALPQLPLGLVTLPGGKAVNLAVSPAAGVFHGPSDIPRRLWAVSDRGPSHDCPGDRDATERDRLICPPGKRGRMMVLPGYSPAIYAIELGEGTARFSDMVTLKDVSGRPLSGVPGPRPEGSGEDSFAADGRPLEPDPSGIDPGALVRVSDGSFLIAEGYGPSLLEVAPDGVIRRRIVPKTLGGLLAAADYPIEPSLPSVLLQRTFGRGFGSLALSRDEAHLYTALQGAIAARPGEPASPLVRIAKIDRKSGQVVAQYAYRPDAVRSEDAAAGGQPHDARIAEMAVLGERHLLVLERNRGVGRIYRLDLAAAQPLPEEREGAEAALERVPEADWPKHAIAPVGKTLVFSNEDAPALAGRLQGMAILSDRELVITTSRESGLESGKSQMFRLTFPTPITN